MVAEQTKTRPTREYPDLQQAEPRYRSAAHQPAARPARPLPPRKVMAHRGSRVMRRARVLGWRSPMTAAVLVGTFLVSLLCCYVYAYARVTATSFQESSLKRELQKLEQEQYALEAEVSLHSLSATVEQRARSRGMVPAPPAEAQILATTVEERLIARRAE